MINFLNALSLFLSLYLYLCMSFSIGVSLTLFLFHYIILRVRIKCPEDGEMVQSVVQPVVSLPADIQIIIPHLNHTAPSEWLPPTGFKRGWGQRQPQDHSLCTKDVRQCCLSLLSRTENGDESPNRCAEVPLSTKKSCHSKLSRPLKIKDVL